MPDQPLTYWDYVRAAFKRSYRMPLLGKMPLNPMALFVFGLAGAINPGFWLLGAAAELSYLGILSANQRFQKLVQGERLLDRQRGMDSKVQETLAALAPPSRERYRRLLDECGRILGIAPTLKDREQGTLTDLRAGGLNQLLALFLRLLTSRQVISTNLAQVNPEALEADVVRLRNRLTEVKPDTPLSRSIQATLEIETKRLANLERAQGSLEVIDAELVRIEQQVRLIREETAVSGGPELLSVRLDAVTETLAETSRWMEQNSEVLGSLALDDLDASGPALPRLGGADEGPTPPPPPPRPAGKQRS